jgi:hypothetical protein
MYALSGALVAVVAAAAVGVYALGGGGQPDTPPFASESDTATVTTAATTAELTTTAADTAQQPAQSGSNEPYSFDVQMNTFDFDVRIARMWGDERNMMLEVELSQQGKHWNDTDAFFEDYPWLRLVSMRLICHYFDGVEGVDSESDSPDWYSFVHGLGDMYAKDGNFYYTMSLSTEPTLILGQELSIFMWCIDDDTVTDDNELSPYLPFFRDEYIEEIAEHYGDVFWATFIADYDAEPFTVFELNLEVDTDTGYTALLERIEISDTSIYFAGIGFDVEVVYEVNGETLPGIVHGSDGMFSGSRGTVYSTSPCEIYREVISGGFIGRGNLVGRFHEGFDKTTIEKIIIGGYEFIPQW